MSAWSEAQTGGQPRPRRGAQPRSVSAPSSGREAAYPLDGVWGRREEAYRARRASLSSPVDNVLEYLSRQAGAEDNSSGSGSTITQVSFVLREPTAIPPDALSFLDPDSPAVTEESIKRSVEAAAHWRMHEPGRAPRRNAAALDQQQQHQQQQQQ